MNTPFGFGVAQELSEETTAGSGEDTGSYDADEQLWVGGSDADAALCTVRCHFNWFCTNPLRLDLTMWC